MYPHHLKAELEHTVHELGLTLSITDAGAPVSVRPHQVSRTGCVGCNRQDT
jgi:hypothetical protein